MRISKLISDSIIYVSVLDFHGLSISVLYFIGKHL